MSICILCYQQLILFLGGPDGFFLFLTENLPVSSNSWFYFFYFFFPVYCSHFTFYFCFSFSPQLQAFLCGVFISDWFELPEFSFPKMPKLFILVVKNARKNAFGVDGNSVCHKHLSVLAAYGQITYPTSQNAPFINPLQCQNLKDEIVITPTSLCMLIVF